MAFIPVPDVVQARLQWQATGGQVAQNVLYCATPGVPTEADLTEIGVAFNEWITESMTSTVTTNWQATGVILRAMNEAEGIEVTYTTDFPIAGLNGGAQTPLQVAYSVTFGTGLVGRSARGRAYMIGLAHDAIVDNARLTDTAQPDLSGRWQNLVTILEDAGHALQVVSFVEGGVPRTEGRALPVLSATVRFPLATQRRRL